MASFFAQSVMGVGEFGSALCQGSEHVTNFAAHLARRTGRAEAPQGPAALRPLLEPNTESLDVNARPALRAVLESPGPEIAPHGLDEILSVAREVLLDR